MFRLILTACLAAALLPAQNHTLTVTLNGFRSDKGMVEVQVYDQAAAYPTKPEKALVKLRGPVANGVASVVFKDLAPGTYAIAAYHDANNNGKMDANFIGIPKEQTGASNDAKGRMGPPAFKDAKFALSGNQSIVITMQ
jgi:uncharacterized protein (DUF2141 family)